MVEVFNISPDYVRILWFLYPEYTILPEGTKRIPKFSKFIAYRDIKTTNMRIVYLFQGVSLTSCWMNLRCVTWY